jgi:peroxiredoxin
MIRTPLLDALAPVMLVAAFASPAMAQVKAGDRLPAAFQPVDQSGAARNLHSLAGAQGLVLILSRSAGWCPVCQAQMVQLKAAAQPLAAKGYGLAVMTYDAPPVLARFSTRQQLPYPLLSDAGSRAIRALGLADPQYPPGHMAHGVPLASVLVIDREGTIQRVEVSPDFRKRPSVEEIIAMAPAR